MKDLTVIIPLNEYNEEVDKLLKRAVDSFYSTDNGDTELLFVSSKNIIEQIKEKYNNNNVSYLETKKTDFCSQINSAVEKCRKYFSVLEYDDVYLPSWFKNVEEYMTFDNDISVFLPLTEIVLFDKPEDGPVGYVNEAVWATSFSEETGYLDIDSLLSYMNFNTTGGVFNTEDFIKNGKLKTSIKLTYWYEYLLRSIYNGKKVFVVPKVGYQHTLNRPNSISDVYNRELKPEEADWWIELAQKDYFFIKERDKSHYIYEG